MAKGCTKAHDPVMRNLTQAGKYYIPEEIYPDKFYPTYYSGAAYVFTGEMALKLAAKKDEVPTIPLDDCYIGSIVEHLNMSHELHRR